MSTKFTPGPWRVGGEYEATQLRPRIDILRDVTFVDGATPTTYRIAEVKYPTTTGNTVGAAERAANARLIAESPSLLENLIGCVEALASHAPDCIEVQCAREVIARATQGH